MLTAAQVTTLTPPAAITGFATSTKQSDGSQKTQVVDGSGNVIGATANALDVNIKSGSSAGTEYTEDAASAADPAGGMLIARRKDTLSATEVSADGDNIALNSTNKGQLHVKLADTVTVDGSGVTQPISAASLPLPTLAATSTKQSDGSQKSQIVDGSGNVIGATSNALNVHLDGGVTVLSGTFTDASDKTEDAAHASGDTGSFILGVRNDALATTFTTTDGDYSPIAVNDKGVVRVDPSGTTTQPVSLASVPSHAVTNAGTFAVQVDGSALTSLQLIDDTVFTDDTSTHSTGSTKGQGIMAVANPTDASVDANDIGMVAMTLARAMKNDITTIAGTAPTTAGFIDIKGADGNVFVRQATASNLNMTEASAASSLTSLQLIDDVVFVDDTATHATGSTKGIGIMGAATPTDTAVNANDIGMVGMTNNRELYVSLRDIAGATAVTGSGTATGALRVELANNGTGLSTVNPGTAANWGVYVEDDAETAGANLTMAGAVRRDSPASSSGTSGDNSTINVDALGKLWVTGSYVEDVAHTAADTLLAVATRRIDTAASSSGTSGDYSTLDSSAEGAVWSTLTPTTTSGCSVFMATSADGSTALTNSAQVVKASAGNLYGYYIYNPNSAATYVHLYNTAAASVTVGATNPLVTFCIPATAGANVGFPYPVTFSNAGWSVSATTTGGGNTAPTTALEAVFFYK